jgi:Site-specific recombinase XerD
MSSIEKRAYRDGKPAWRAHYRAPDGRQRNKTFRRKVDAERFLATVEGSKLTGAYIDPTLARMTVDAWAVQWFAGQGHLKPSTRHRYEGIMRTHVVPRWGGVRLADVSHAAIQTWITELSAQRAPSSVTKIHRVLSMILEHAVRDGRLARNPASGVRLPRVVRGEHIYLSHAQVDQLALRVAHPYDEKSRAPYVDREAALQYELVVLFLAYTGVRWGEMAALRVKRLDLARRRATIAESVTIVRGKPVWGTPKGNERRDVPIPRFLARRLRARVANHAPDDLIFTGVKGGVLRAKVFQDAILTRAARELGLPGLTPHKLRHTAASLAIASGANVKVVQQMLGHKSATMTLDLYGHLFGDQLDEVADALDIARRASAQSPVANLLPNRQTA